MSHAYALKRLAADGFDDNGEIVVSDMRARRASFARGSNRRDRRGDRNDRQGAGGVGQGRRDRKRLMTIPGVGRSPAFLGLTPRQSSTGGKERLGRITKMGDRYCASS